jgi:hypothetical protein
MGPTDVIQLLAVLVAVAASIVAITIATQDRKVQLRIARQDREQARLALELEYAIRLSANRNMGGSTDPAETKRLGAEAMALVGVVGERWVPEQYARIMEGHTPETLAAAHAGDDTPQWVKWRTESTLAVQRIVAEIYEASDADER